MKTKRGGKTGSTKQALCLAESGEIDGRSSEMDVCGYCESETVNELCM